MSKYVHVVTNLELGWDNIVAVFDSDVVSFEELEKRFKRKDMYIIHCQKVETSLEEYE